MNKLVIAFFFISNFIFSQNNKNVNLLNVTNNYLNNYSVKTYNKLIVTANPTLLTADSISDNHIIIDSANFKFKKLIKKQHLYQTEKISENTWFNSKKHEVILATKMAGFKNPVFEYFAFQMQPNTVYDDNLIFIESKFVNPISKKGSKKYIFDKKRNLKLLNRSQLVYTFSEKKSNKKNNFSGIIYIDSITKSVSYAKYNSNGILKIINKHEFEFNEVINNWVPKLQKLLIKKGNSKYPIKIFGETISFNGNEKNQASDFVEIQTSTFFSDYNFNTKHNFKNKSIAISIDENALKKTENIWYKKYNDSLDIRSNPTYVSLDSIVEKRKIENKIQLGRKVINGYYPINFFDFDFRYLFKYNNYEGIRLGIGGVTNEKFSKNYKIEGFYAYGIKDGVFKGFISNSVLLNKKNESWLGISFTDDLKEVASTAFEIDKRKFKIYDPRPFNITTFYNHLKWKIFFETKLIPKTETILQLSTSKVKPKFDYVFVNNEVEFKEYQISLFTASMQWNPFSNYMQTPSGKIEIAKTFPRFTFQFSKSISKLFQNDFNFGKFDLRFEYQKKFNSNHKLKLLLNSGLALGDLPLTHLYNNLPNSLTKTAILQRINFAGTAVFETMRFNEFFSNRFVFFQIENEFPKALISKKLKPIFSVISRYGWGNMTNKKAHKNLEFKTLQKGYLESGFEANSIFKGLGLGFYYRYGANSLPTFDDNFAVKINFQLDLGFNN